MPIYEYVCLDCGEKFDALRSMAQADAPIGCRACEGEHTSRTISVFAAVSEGRVVAGSNGEALFVAPQSGEIVGNLELPGRVHLPPVVAGGTLYFLADNAKLIAFR